MPTRTHAHTRASVGAGKNGASPEGKAWIESGRPCPIPPKRGTRDVLRRLITTPKTTHAAGTDSGVHDATAE